MLYRFNQIAFNSTAKKKPTEEDKEHYIGLEHLDSDCLSVTRWGAEVAPIGEKLLMKKGDILFGKRRAYQRKVGIAPFDGIFSAHGMVLRPNEDIINKDFFPFFICSDQFMERAVRISVGGLSPTINWKDLREQEFELPPLSEQRILAEKLWSAYRLKESYKRLLVATDEMVKSQFIEMFGNPITNTKGWATAKIKDVAPENPSKEQLSGKVWLLNLDMIESNTGKVIEKVYEDVENALSVQAFDEGNVLFSKLRPYLNKVVIPDEPGLATTELVPLRPEPSRLHKVFLSHLLRGSHFVNYANDISGGTKMPRMPLSELRNFECILPPMDLQRQFVSIAEQADKSKFVGFKSQFIEMFGNTTPTKKISDICNVRGGSTPTRTMKEYWEDGTVSWFTVEDIYEQGRYISDTKQHITELATKKCFVYPIDTVLICCTASVGEYAITKKEMASNQQFNGMIIKDKNKVHPEFLLYVASTLKDDLLRKAGKTTINFVSRSKLEEIEIPVPAIEEQKRFISIFQQADKSKLIELSNKCYHKIYSIPTIQKKLLENGSPKATIETDESRSYFLIDIPCRKDFVQDDSILRQIDIHRVTINLMTKCPRYVQDMSKIEVEHLSVCILKSRTAVSAQIMLEGVDKVSYKQKRRKYLDKLLEMGVLLMTIPEKPTSRNQQYILSEYGKGLLE